MLINSLEGMTNLCYPSLDPNILFKFLTRRFSASAASISFVNIIAI